MPSPISLPEPTKMTQAGTAPACFLRSIQKVVMRNARSRFPLKATDSIGKGATLASWILLALFGMTIPSAQALSTTNVFGFAKTTETVMESEGITQLMIVRKEGTRGAIQVEG